MYSVPHFFFHLTHLEVATTAQAVALTVTNALAALMGLAVIALTVAQDRREKSRSSSAPLEGGPGD